MNYLLFHLGKIPKHFYTCVNNILSIDKDAKIFVLTDNDLKLNAVEILNINDLKTLLLKKEEILSIYKNTHLESNPLWYTSFLRVFGLKEASEHYQINKFIHFDNDVLIYKSFSEINKLNVIKKNKINITQIDETKLVFGYSYFDSSESIKILAEYFDKVLNQYKYFVDSFHKGKPLTEMRIMKLAQDTNPNLFSILPSLPYESSIIFDPASYGQYLNGTHLKRGNYIFKRRWISTNHIVGRELKSKRVEVMYKKGIPLVKFENNFYDIANLHIHSKNLEKYVSNDYVEYFK